MVQREVIANLFVTHHLSLQRFLRGRLRRGDEAADLVQETYYRLLRRPDLSIEGATARALLFHTATNLARDHHRRRLTRRADQHVDCSALEIAADQLGPDEQLSQAQTLSAIEGAFRELSPRTRKMLSLRLAHDWTYAVIAREMNVSKRTVARSMAEALERLRAACSTA